MAGSWWRLLAAFLLILIAGLLRGQESAAVRVPPPSDPQPIPLARASVMDSMPPSGLVRPGIALPAPPIGRYPPASGPIGFPQIVHPAGIIFSGTVTAISHALPEKHAVTAITFKVEAAIRGVSRDQTLTIHEWAGLWSHGERYRVGEHVFLFLYSPSRLGLTSPVAGGMGRFRVDPSGRILLSNQHLHMLANDPILGGKSSLSYADFARAIQRVSPSD
jgi:hypothetical protein